MCGEPFGVARPVQDAAHDPDLEQVGHVLAAFAFLVDKLAGVVDLLAVEFGRRPAFDASCPRGPHAFARALDDEAAFKLGQCAEDMKYQSVSGCGGVDFLGEQRGNE